MAKRQPDRKAQDVAPTNPVLGERLRDAGFAASVPDAPVGVPKAGAEQPPVSLAGAGKIVLARERKGRGGKTVTVARGLPPGHLDRLAKEMRKALGCGSAVEGGAIVLQGDIAGRARDWLEAHEATKVVIGN